MNQHFGTYQTFKTASKDEGAALLGADNLVGDVYEIEIELTRDVHEAWLVNRFGKRVGFFDGSFSRKLSVLKARGLAVKALLSYVAFTDQPEPGFYWGEMAVVAYNPAHEELFSRYLSRVAAKLEEGVRPQLDLTARALAQLGEAGGDWVSDHTVPLPSKDKGTVIMKSKRSASDKIIEQGRKGNKGCYVISWAFIIVAAAAVLLLLKSCLGF